MTTPTPHWATAVALCTSLSAGQALATPIDLGDAARYNGFFFSDFSSTANDSQGALAIGGNANLSGYTVNTLGSTATPALVAGGDLSFHGGDINGDTIVGGQASFSGGGSLHGQLQFQQSQLPVDFSTSYQHLTQLSNSLALSAGGTVGSQWGSILFTGDGSQAQQAFSLDQAGFEDAHSFFANNIDQDQAMIINVAGEHIDIDSADFLMKAQDWSWIGNAGHVLYNFYEAETIDLSAAFHGTMLATNAHINANGGSVDGQVIAQSWNGATQLNAPLFQHHEPSVEVPEPATWWLMSLGMLGILVRRR